MFRLRLKVATPFDRGFLTPGHPVRGGFFIAKLENQVMRTNWKTQMKKVTETLFLILVMGFMPVMGLLGGFSGCNQPQQKTVSQQKKLLSKKPIILKQGQSITLNDFIYKFNGFRYSNYLKDYWQPGKSAKTENLFLVASITIQNSIREPASYSYATLFPLFIKDTDGNIYHSIDMTELDNLSHSNRLHFSQLNPKVLKTVDLAFEVPGKKAYTLVLQPEKTDPVNGLHKSPRTRSIERRNTKNYGY